MAIQQALTASTGSSYDSAYYRVIQLHLDYQNLKGSVEINVYKDKVARDSNFDVIQQIQMNFMPQATVVSGVTIIHSFPEVFGIANLKNQDPLAAVYKYLCSLPDFSKATSN